MTRELKNCFSCGRDCTSESGYCYRCIGIGQQMPSEKKDRHVIRYDGDPIVNINCDFNEEYGLDYVERQHIVEISYDEEKRRFKKFQKESQLA